MAKYSKGAGKKVKEAMHEKKEGTLKSGRSGKKVTSRKQTIAIGLSEARERGEKVPLKSGSKGASKKSSSKGGRSKSSSKFASSKASGGRRKSSGNSKAGSSRSKKGR